MAPYFFISIFGCLGILIELVLARALDFSLNSFVAWMCVSGAMFGLGLGGLLFERRPATAASSILGILGLALLALPASYNQLSFSGGAFNATINYSCLIFLLSMPFALIGWGTMNMFARPELRARRLYLFDLVGSSLGALAGLVLLGPLSPALIVVLAGLLCLVLSQTGRRRAMALTLALVGAAVVLHHRPGWLEFKAKDVKRLHRLLAAGSIEETIWTPAAKVDVVAARKGAKVIVYDGGEMLSTIYPFDGDYAKLRGELGQRLFSDFWNPGVLASHYLKDGQSSRVLAVGAAGGQEVKAALLFGAATVEVAEIMGELLELGKNHYSKFNGGIFLRPEVRVFARDGRAHLRDRPSAAYDIIQLNSVHGSSSRGSSMGALQVSSLVTAEAFAEYFAHLAPEGLLHLNYLYYPRLITTMSEAWRKLGRSDFRRHVLVIESGRTDQLTTVLVKMSPWSETEVQRVEELFRMPAVKFRPYTIAEHPLRGGRLQDEYFDGRWREIADSVPYRIFPATDDQPYFKFLRKGLFLTLRVFDPAVPPDLVNYLYNWRTARLPGDIFPLVALGSGCLVIFLVALLMASTRLPVPGFPWPAVSYFFLTGFGFISLETFFVYRASLWLGAPHLALAVGLGVILLSAGLGGAWARWSPAGTCLVTVAVAGLASRIPNGDAVALGLLCCGLVMGMPFVAGVDGLNLGGRARSGAFLISGLGAGFGGYIAVVASLAWGFSAVLLVACVSYLTAALVSRLNSAAA